jgi:hypothetical protein
MARTNIAELTEDQVIEAYTRKFFRPVFTSTPPIPASYDGKYVCLAAIAMDVELSEAQMDALETAIEAITGVHKAFVLIGSARLPLDRTPVDHDLTIGVEASFDIKPPPA